MNIEVCSGSCTGEKRVFSRNYDVTKRTSFRRHYTGMVQSCKWKCSCKNLTGGALMSLCGFGVWLKTVNVSDIDTDIFHFGSYTNKTCTQALGREND